VQVRGKSGTHPTLWFSHQNGSPVIKTLLLKFPRSKFFLQKEFTSNRSVTKKSCPRISGLKKSVEVRYGGIYGEFHQELFTNRIFPTSFELLMLSRVVLDRGKWMDLATAKRILPRGPQRRMALLFPRLAKRQDKLKQSTYPAQFHVLIGVNGHFSRSQQEDCSPQERLWKRKLGNSWRRSRGHHR
jgi:hypothetical protein